MTRPVNTVPPLPYPGGRDDNRSLAAFDQDLVKALQIYLGELARRANAGLGIDGTDVMTGDLNMGFNDLINAISLTIVRSASITSQGLTIGPSNATGHFIRGFSPPTNAKNIIYNATTDDADTVPSSGSNRHLFQIRGAEKFTIDDDGAVSVVSGWLKFPATAIPSTDPNTIDEYQEQLWTPSLTFDTPGDLAITYGSRVGRVTKVGRMVHVSFVVTTSAFTHSTASGSFRITGLPFSAVSGWEQTGTTEHQNLSLSAPYHQVNLNLQSGRTDLRLVASGASAGRVALSPTHVPSGVNLSFVGQITYEASA